MAEEAAADVVGVAGTEQDPGAVNPDLGQGAEGTGDSDLGKETTLAEGKAGAEGDSGDPKTFTQEELEAEIGKRLARQERKLKREQQSPELPPLDLKSELKSEDFTTTEAYIEALADERVEALIAQKEEYNKVSAVETNYQERVESALEKYDDFEAVAYNPEIRISGEMAQIIKASEQGPDLAYFLGKNPKEASRISKLNPLLQGVELGKLELGLKDSQKPAISKAADPIVPVHGKTPSSPALDTTDPKSTENMTASEWIAADRARRAKLYRSQGFK